jgi:hypothetical protein
MPLIVAVRVELADTVGSPVDEASTLIRSRTITWLRATGESVMLSDAPSDIGVVPLTFSVTLRVTAVVHAPPPFTEY